MSRYAQDVAIAPVRMDIGGQNARLIGGFQHHRARPVAKQDTGTPVVEIEDARKYFRPNYQGPAGSAGFEHGIRHGQSINEATAHSLHIKRRAAVGNAQLVLHNAGRRREHHVRRAGGNNDQVNLVGFNTCGFERLLSGQHSHVTATNPIIGKPAGLDAGAFNNPLMRCFNARASQLLHQILIGYTSRR